MADKTAEGSAIGTAVAQPKKYTLKKELAEAGWLIAAGSTTDLIQKALAGVMMRGLSEDDQVSRVAVSKFLDSELGKFVIAMATSGLLNSAGALIGDKIEMVSEEKLAFLADRMRVMAFTRGGMKIVEEFSEPVLEGIKGVLQGLPDLPDMPEAPKEIEAHRATVSETIKDRVEQKVA